MTKIAMITDTHWGVRNDNQNFIEHFREFYEKTFFPTLKENGINKLLMLGDTFDRRKFSNHVTLWHAKNIFFSKLEEYGIETWMLIGNHDIPYRNINTPNVPELALVDFKNIHFISNEAQTINIDGTEICMVPWMNASNYGQCISHIKETKATICCGHFEIKGFAMYKDSISDDGLERDLFKKFEYTFSGHYHHKSNSDGIYYLGNPYQLTWQDYGDDRGFHILDLSSRELTFVKNPYEMFVRYIYDDTDKTFENIMNFDVSAIKNKYVKIVVLKKSNPYAFDMFINKLYEYDPADINIVEEFNNDNSEDDELDQTQDTITILNSYIDSLKTNESFDVNKLKNIMREVYVEALNTQQD